MNRQKGFANLFVFAKIFVGQDRKSGVRVVVGQPNFSLDTAVFKFLNYCYWMCKHTQISFLPDSSFNIWEKPSSFQKGPRSH